MLPILVCVWSVGCIKTHKSRESYDTVCWCSSCFCLVISDANDLCARMEKLQRKGNLRRGARLCLLLLALLHEATGQRRKTGRRNNYRLHDDGGNGKTLCEMDSVGSSDAR